MNENLKKYVVKYLDMSHRPNKDTISILQDHCEFLDKLSKKYGLIYGFDLVDEGDNNARIFVYINILPDKLYEMITSGINLKSLKTKIEYEFCLWENEEETIRYIHEQKTEACNDFLRTRKSMDSSFLDDVSAYSFSFAEFSKLFVYIKYKD